MMLTAGKTISESSLDDAIVGARAESEVLNDTKLTQSTVSMNAARRKPLFCSELRRAVFGERRGQDSNLRKGLTPSPI